MTRDLIGFLRARLDEDERVARDANTSPEMVTGIPRSYAAAPVAIHIARWNPARVLAEVAAKQKVVNLHSPRRTPGPTMPVGGEWTETYNLDCITCGGDDRLSPSWPCKTILLLAAPYADHADYWQGWTP